MAKLNNKGFSLTEIVIAIAVFTALSLPIVQQLSVSMNINENSKLTQKTSEYAEYVMEYFKSTPLSDIGKDDLFDGANEFVETASEVDKTVTVGGVAVQYKESQFEIPKTSAVGIGYDRDKFYCTVTVDTKEYALTQAGFRSATDAEIAGGAATYAGSDGKQYVKIEEKQDPNQVNVGNLTNLDGNVVAIIAGHASNMDERAADTLFTLKADKLKEDDEEKWQQLMYGEGFNDFAYDTVKKVTRITITNEGSKASPNYRVSCDVEYKDSNTKYAVDPIYYNVYNATFKQKEIPVIYFMYNPCVYNKEYMASDYVVLDTEGIGNIGEQKVKMYMVETAAKISANIQTVMDENGIAYDTLDLIQPVDESGTRTKRYQIDAHFNICGDVDDIEVYTNIDLDEDGVDGSSDETVNLNDYTVFTNVDASHPANDAPGSLDGGKITHFVRPLWEDSEYIGRLYTITVKLFSAEDDSLVTEFTGTRGAEND